MKDLYLGEGIYDLENDGQPFRWVSDCFHLYIYNKNIKELKIKLYSEVDGYVNFELNEKKLNNKIEKGLGLLSIIIPEYNNTLSIKISQPWFTPSERYKTSDTRKLSYRIYNVILVTDTDQHILYNVSDIDFYNKHLLNNIDSNISVKKVGLYGEMFLRINSSNASGKLNLNIDQTSFYSHRSGWNYVLHNLVDLHNENGVLFDGFLENSFSWRKDYCIKNDILPYKKPWVGFLHNPPNMPLWFSDNNAYPQSILHDIYFKKSLDNCKGLYVLSNYYKKFLNFYIPHIPIEVLYHPTEIPKVKFNYDKFINNNNKKIINIGWWLRKLNSIFLLDCDIYKKIRLMPNNKCKDTVLRLTNIERSLYDLKLDKKQLDSVEFLDFLENDEYDELLSENIIFLDLYDTGANNAVVECIARGTPLLINKHPATIEYLGDEYPFYFNNLDEASKKSKDYVLINETHEYLMNFDKRKQITIEYFKNQLLNGEIYKSL